MIRNELVSNMRYSNRCGSHSGCCRIYSNNTYQHEKLKFDIMYKLLQKGCECWSEAIWTNNSRSDIVAYNPKNGNIRIIEVLNSEELEEAKLKKEKYPYEIIFIKVGDPKYFKDIDI